MSIEILIILVIFMGFLLAAALYLLYSKKREPEVPIAKQGIIHVSQTESPIKETGGNLAIFDEDGARIAESREIHRIPPKAHRIGTSDSALNRVRHLASDLFKGAVSIPNKTVEVVFNPDIQKGLAEGSYTLMRTKSGEVLADAVNSSGKFVGKGRLIEGGKARQIASGAFQLVSIAVAQSHLADIERSLGVIKDSISDVLKILQNEKRANITGAFDYLKEIATHMKELRGPEELSQQKKIQIENIIRDSYTWRNELEGEVSSLTNEISNLKSLDTFGTGATFDRLKGLLEKVKPLLERHELLINLASATNFVTAYLDPAQCEFSRVKPESDNWEGLVNNLNHIVKTKSSDRLSKAFWTSNELLRLRKVEIDTLADKHLDIAIAQQKSYEQLTNVLEKNLGSLIGLDGKIRVAISFDEHGEVKDAAIL